MANNQYNEFHIYFNPKRISYLKKPGDATIQKSVFFSGILVLSEALEQTKNVWQH